MGVDVTSQNSAKWGRVGWSPLTAGSGDREHEHGQQKQNSSFCTLLCCCCSTVVKSCATLCDPMNCSSMPGFPVLHYLMELAQIYVHWVCDAIQPSQPLSSPSPLALTFPSIKVFSNESALLIRWPKYWSFSCITLNSFGLTPQEKGQVRSQHGRVKKNSGQVVPGWGCEVITVMWGLRQVSTKQGDWMVTESFVTSKFCTVDECQPLSAPALLAVVTDVRTCCA